MTASPLDGKTLLFLGLVATIAIRIPYDKKSSLMKVTTSHRTLRENVLLFLVALGVLLAPLVAIFTPLLSFADYPPHPIAFLAGAAALALNVWLFHRSHADLGENWSKTLEIRENHRLITTGVYRTIRHPMYTAIFLFVIAQALLLPNWLAGSSGLVAFGLMYVLRVGPEERMMTEAFGDEYRDYMRRTKRLIPGVF